MVTDGCENLGKSIQEKIDKLEEGASAEAAAGSEADNERLKATETQLAELKDVQSKLPTAEKLAEVEQQVAELKEAQSKLPTDEKLSAAVEEEKAARESALATLQEKVDELAKPAADAAEET